MINDEDVTEFMREIVDTFIDCMFVTRLDLPTSCDYSSLNYIILNNMNFLTLERKN